MTENEIITGCFRSDRKAQEQLYKRYADKMFGVCMRYVKNRENAEDLLIEGFFKVMTKIDQYSEKGSFEGWIRRIMVNECLMFLRKNDVLTHASEIDPDLNASAPEYFESNLMAADLLKLLDELPTGYRTVFNLYVLEGYKHREIADLLGISINTSKSQLILARKKLEKLVFQLEYPIAKNDTK